MAKIGQFIKAPVKFADGDDRFKIRPCLVLAKAKHGDNIVYLCAPRSTKTSKIHGEVEVIFSKQEAEKVGLDAEGVIRFNRGSLVAILDHEVTNVYGMANQLDPRTFRAIQNAARSVGCTL